jgi:hypothetical protein
MGTLEASSTMCVVPQRDRWCDNSTVLSPGAILFGETKVGILPVADGIRSARDPAPLKVAAGAPTVALRGARDGALRPFGEEKDVLLRANEKTTACGDVLAVPGF